MTDPHKDRPTIVVHMASSVDGRIQTKRWSPAAMGSYYEDLHERLGGDAWMCGRITMQGYTRGTPQDDTDPAPVPRADHVVRRDASGYAVALDAHGRLHWGSRNEIEGDHVVVVLLEEVPDQHLNALRRSGVSYLFGGRGTIDFPLVLGKLKRLFGIGRLLVEGGGGINGSLLAAGLVDELSLLLVPAVDGGRGVPSVFDYDVREGQDPAKSFVLALTRCEALPSGLVHLRYRFDRVEAALTAD